MENKSLNNYESLYEEFNIETKRMYHEWFNKYIEGGKEKEFENAVIAMGNTYGVLRTLPRINREAFFKDIWDNREKIKSGEYDWTKEIEGRHFWSYLSKVCYLISPEKYKIIYDDNNKTSLGKLYPEKSWNPKNWQGNINEIFDDLENNKYREKLKKYNSPKKYFCIDFLLWDFNKN